MGVVEEGPLRRGDEDEPVDAVVLAVGQEEVAPELQLAGSRVEGWLEGVQRGVGVVRGEGEFGFGGGVGEAGKR